MAEDSGKGGAQVNCPTCGQDYPVSEVHRCLYERTTQRRQKPGTDSGAAGPVLRTTSMENGQIIGEKYQIVKRLSEGGMGTVYVARHTGLGSLVAIKLLKSDGDPQFEQRFVQEAQLASSVRHPNIVYLSDFGSLPDGRSYLVMEYLQGRTLSDALKQESFTVQRACMVALQLVRGILAVHEKGIVHRDLKPDNVFLIEQSGVQDLVKIIDFGIAKRAKESGHSTTLLLPQLMLEQARAAAEKPSEPDDAEEPGQDRLTPEAAVELTRAGALLGTPGYMAPEQIRGAKVDRRADQYAIGCILYKMLTGRAVFDGKTSVDLLAQHLIETPLPLREAAPGVEISEALEQLVMRLLEKKATKRCRSLEEVEAALLAELQAPSDGLNLVTRKVPGLLLSSAPTHQLAPLPKRVLHRPTLMAGACGLLLLLVAAAWLLLHRRSPALPSEEALLQMRELATARLWEDVRDPAVEVRLAAINAIGASHEPLALPLLAAVAQGNGSDRERSAALLAIGELGEHSGVSILSNVFSRAQTPQITDAAAQALLLSGDEKGAAHFARRMAAKDAVMAMRSAVLLCEHENTPAIVQLSAQLAAKQLPEFLELDALTCLSRAGSARATELLRGFLLPTIPAEKALAAAERLAKLGQPAGLNYLQQVAQNDVRMRLKAAVLLASPDDRSGLPLFRSVLAQKSALPSERELAISALAECGELTDLPGLSTQLQAERSPLLRIAVASAILKLTGNLPLLRNKLDLRWARAGMNDPNWMARHSAVPLLDRNAESESTALLSRALSDEKIQVRTRVIQVISRSSSRDALKLLEVALKNDQPEVREASLRAVVQVARSAYLQGGSTASDVKKWLQGLLKSTNETQRAGAQAGLSHLGDTAQWAELKKLKGSPDRVLRGLLAHATVSDRDLLASLLGDSAISVRLAAAQRLAQLKDARGVAVLREGLGQGGAPGLRSEAALRNLGESLAGQTVIERLHRSESVEERMAFVETAGSLPPDEAMKLLTEAAHDAEPYVRRLAAELVAELSESVDLGPRLALLAHLNRDQSPMVRTRAAVLLSRLLHETRETKTPPPKRAPAAPSRTFSPDDAKPTPPTPAAPESKPPGELSLAAANPILFRIDGGNWQRTPARPVKLSAGAHRLRYVGGQQDVEVNSAGSVLFELPESPAEQNLRAGRDALSKRDYRRAQKLFEKTLASCAIAGELAVPCRALQAEAGYLLGGLFEAQERWGEAVTEYQQAASKVAEIAGRVDFHTEAKAALGALMPRVGQVIIPQIKKSKCAEVTLWMAAGKHDVIVGGKKVNVVVRPGATALAGECPSDE